MARKKRLFACILLIFSLGTGLWLSGFFSVPMLALIPGRRRGRSPGQARCAFMASRFSCSTTLTMRVR